MTATRQRMRLLYCAIDQTVPGTTGGSIHVLAVAEGMAARGHDVHVLAAPGTGGFPDGRVQWHASAPPLGRAALRWMRAGAVTRLARTLAPDAIIERYYNFGGEGLSAAAATGAVGVLEVNAPIIDYPGSPKARLDRVLLVEPMRRWRDHQCRLADLILTPSRRIVPDWLPPDRIVEIEWGADTTRFSPGAPNPTPFPRTAADIVCVFAGAFRSWHGAHHLVDALRTLHMRGRHDYRAMFIGDGPELDAVRERAAGLDRIHFTGTIAHERVPAYLASSDIGVAPFDVGAHPPLQLDFYWSPLKVFEYMAAGLPVVTPRIGRLATLVTDGREGVLYDPTGKDGLADALESLVDASDRRRLGAAARQRAVNDFSWLRHCEKVEAAIVRTKALASR